jgi:hypothetical protein
LSSLKFKREALHWQRSRAMSTQEQGGNHHGSLIEQAMKCIVGGRCRTRGVTATGAAFDSDHFLSTLAADHDLSIGGRRG